jgi:hypothetical protein
VALQTTGVGSTGVPIDRRICDDAAHSYNHLHHQQTESPVLPATLRRLQGLQRSIHYHRDRLQDLQRSNYNTNRLIAGYATVQLQQQQQSGSTAGSAAITTTMADRLQGLQRLSLLLLPATTAGSAADAPQNKQSTYRNPRSGRQFAHVALCMSTPTRGATTAAPIHSVGRSGGKPHDKLVGNVAESDNDFIPATSRAQEATISHISTPFNFIESSHTTQQHRMPAGVCWRKLPWGAGVLAS